MIAAVIKGRALRIGDLLLTDSSVRPWARVTSIQGDFDPDPVWLDVQCEHQPRARVSASSTLIVVREGSVF